MSRASPLNGADHPGLEPAALAGDEAGPHGATVVVGEAPSSGARPLPARRRVRMADIGKGEPRPDGASAPVRPRASLLARMEEQSAAARRGRLADRLVHLAKLRRLEEERARLEAEKARASRIVVTEAVPLEKLGFMGLMLRPPGLEARTEALAPAQAGSLSEASSLPALPSPPAPETRPEPAQAAGFDASAAAAHMPPPADIAALMAEYRARSATVIPFAPPASAEPKPAAENVLPAQPVPVDHGPEALATLDPVRRLAGALQPPTVAPELLAAAADALATPVRPPGVDAEAAPCHPAPRMGATDDGGSAGAMPKMQPAPEPVPAPAPRPTPTTAVRPLERAWPSFAAGFAAAIGVGIGLYVYLGP